MKEKNILINIHFTIINGTGVNYYLLIDSEF